MALNEERDITVIWWVPRPKRADKAWDLMALSYKSATTHEPGADTIYVRSYVHSTTQRGQAPDDPHATVSYSSKSTREKHQYDTTHAYTKGEDSHELKVSKRGPRKPESARDWKGKVILGPHRELQVPKMTDSIDIPDRKSRRMRHQEYSSPASYPSAPMTPAGMSKDSRVLAGTTTRPDMSVLADMDDDSLYSSPSSLGGPSVGGSPATFPNAMKLAERKSKDKGKGRAVDATQEQKPSSPLQGRRTSFMGESISRAEHTVIDIGDPDGVPRLITCVKSGQGFAWNQDLLLPSYLCDREHTSDLERRQDPVQDIILTDEEMQCMFPQ